MDRTPSGSKQTLYALNEEQDISLHSGEEDNVAEDDELGELDPLIYALAPRLVARSSSQVDVTASPAFQNLDQLFIDGKISGEKVARLKSKYQGLLSVLKTSRKNESDLLQNAKALLQQAQTLRSELEKGDSYPLLEDNETSRSRTDLLRYTNEIMATEEQLSHLQYKIEGLTDEKKILEKEYARLPRKDDIEKQETELHKAIEECKTDIAQKIHESKNLKEEHVSKLSQLEAKKEAMEITLSQQQAVKNELIQAMSEPSHIAKQADLITRQLRGNTERKAMLEQQIEEYNAELRNIANLKTNLTEERDHLSKTLDHQRTIYEKKEREVSILTKEYELAKERQAELLGDRSTLEVNLKYATNQKKNEHDARARKIREEAKCMRAHKKALLQLRVVGDSLSHVQGIYDKVKSHMDAMPKDDGTLLEKRKEIQREVDVAKRTLAQQNALTAHERQRVEQGLQEEERLLAEQGQMRVDVVDLTRLAQIKAEEREQKARDFLKAELRVQKALEDLRTKELTIQDSSKKLAEVQAQLAEFAKLYDVIKNERNKCVNLIQSSTQRLAEMQEKTKILHNEVEILRTAASGKERLLQKASLKHNNAVIIRDSLRNEVNKQVVVADDLRKQREQQRLAISKLNEMINKAEERLVNLRKQYEAVVQERNSRGIQLIERNEEVCVFYEKLNVQASVLRNGEMELKSREEEIRFLKMEVTDLKRTITLLRKSIPDKRALDEELVTLQLQLLQCQEYLIDLEKVLENPNDSSRVRILGGHDPSQEELASKLDELENRLAEKEEKLLEKELILEEVRRLADRVKKKSDLGKEDTLKVAKKVNDLQAKIKDVTRKMMAMVSELSMNQANAMKLQQEVREKEGLLEQSYMRLERGEAPNDEMEREWFKMVREEERRARDKENKQMAEEEKELYQIPGGVFTAAEPRPNAYIPDDESELPIPRPYGANAPFKPSEPGTNMRHIRKPVIKPIEI